MRATQLRVKIIALIEPVVGVVALATGLALWIYPSGIRASDQKEVTTPVRIDRGVIERTKHGVAMVRTGQSSGSGFFVRIGASIVCITNRHVVESAVTPDGLGRMKQIARVTVRTAAGRETGALVWKLSANHDIAVLRLDELLSDIIPLDIDEGLPRKGSPVFVWGAPYGEALVPLDGLVEQVSPGALHDVAGDRVELIYVRISIAPGNSGGPLLTPDGRVLGVITRRAEEQGASTGIGIAVASRTFWTSIRNFDVPVAPLSRAKPSPTPERPPNLSPNLQPPQPSPQVRPYPYSSPQANLTMFEKAQAQSRQLACREILYLPPGLAVYTYRLTVRDMKMLQHLPEDSIRITELRLRNPAIVELDASPSVDGTPTLVCVM